MGPDDRSVDLGHLDHLARSSGSSGGAPAWRKMLDPPDSVPLTNLIRRCTYAEQPFGDEAFLQEIELETGRQWRRFAYRAALSTAELALSLDALRSHIDQPQSLTQTPSPL